MVLVQTREWYETSTPCLVTAHILKFSKKKLFLAREKRQCSDPSLSEYLFCDDWMPQIVIQIIYHKKMTDLS